MKMKVLPFVSAFLLCVQAISGHAEDKVSPHAQTNVTTNECTGGWQYAFNSAGQMMTLNLQPKTATDATITVNINPAVTTPTISGSQIGSVWNLDVILPTTFSSALTTAFTKNQLLYVSASFAVQGGGPTLNLMNFSMGDTGAHC